MLYKIILTITYTLFLLAPKANAQEAYDKDMSQLWQGETKRTKVHGERGKLFRDGNYAMFIHWGLYAHIANQWNDSTYYGISEWIMNRNMANIPIAEYKRIANAFNPTQFDANAVAELAKKAGMKYIIITSKHHDGFSMFHSHANPFNIVDATPYGKDPMKELAAACKAAGLGFGFYYSQNQDWTTPGAEGGPKTDAEGRHIGFDEYFHTKCLPEVEQITTEYGPIALVWFDTPGNMDKKYAEKLVEIVHKNQPGAYVSGRVGHGMGDYTTLGDMEIPRKKVGGLWETVDVTNDSWGYAWYDQNWKSPKQIIKNVISTVARGGTYMLNVGLKGDGTIPAAVKYILEQSGRWIHENPETVYGAGASPWQQAFAWGDAVVQGNQTLLTVYDWPQSGQLFINGLRDIAIAGVSLKDGEAMLDLAYCQQGNWLTIELPEAKPNPLTNVIKLVTNKPLIAVDAAPGIDPALSTLLAADFASAFDCNKRKKSWMEKFGEWKHIIQVDGWKSSSAASWEIEICEPGYYAIDLTYQGVGRLAWKVESSTGQAIQNQQHAANVYHEYPIGWLRFDSPGIHRVDVKLLDGFSDEVSLKAIRVTPVDM